MITVFIADDHAIVRQGFTVRQMLWIRQRQRWHHKLAFAAHMEHLTARNQQLQARTGCQQFHQQWRCRHDLLKVVQHEQPVLLT